MADITISIPSGVTARVLDAVALGNGYDATVHGTKAAFAKTVLIRLIKEEVRRVEARLAVDSAATTVNASIETDITIT